MNSCENAVDMINAALKEHRFERLLPVKAIRAAVLMPIVIQNDEVCLLFEVRSRKIGQGGEICFPGGRIEENEAPYEAAVRETKEELLVSPDNISLTAPMFKMIGPAGADVFAYLGEIKDYAGTFSEAEVESTFCIPIRELMSIEPKLSDTVFVQTPQSGFHYELIPGGRDYPWADIKKHYYFYETRFGVIWGMTGELLHRLLEVFSDIGTEAYL